MKTVRVLRLSSGREPFEEWIGGFSENVRAIGDASIDRFLEGGGRRNVRCLKDGVFELKIDRGPGWRVYFGMENMETILLILGGHKGTQDRDIRKAKYYWRLYAQK
ncbi:MAG: type II toxin-antitoxin system RelE/ParE family toxin [Burkholderiales bacterium]|nr:type II toxin-antitoxin system RelE/ParE family toxin [Burkholderiales bacterium]